MKMSGVDWVAFVLVMVGAINWGLVGFFDWNLVEAILGAGTITMIVYDLVGLSALWSIWHMTRM